jgi:hypothetical protein
MPIDKDKGPGGIDSSYGRRTTLATRAFKTSSRYGESFVEGVSTGESLLNGGLISSVASIVENYERSKEKNPRVNPTIRSCELVSDTVYADTTALGLAFAANANTNKGGKVGTASSYVIQVSDGTSWTTPTSGVLGYLRTGVSTTGYASAVNFAPATFTNAPPATGGAAVTKPFRLYGAMPWVNNGLQGLGFFTTAGARAQSATGRVLISTDEVEPILRCGGFGTYYFLMVDLHDGNGPRIVVDPALNVPPYSNLAFLGGAAGGINPVKLDVSQLGGFGRRKRSLVIPVPWDVTLTDFRIKPTSSYFQPQESPRIVFITDSMGATVFQGDQKDGYVAICQDFFGNYDTILLGEGGTGFVNRNGTNRTHLMKCQNLSLIPQYANPSVIVHQASANDNNQAGISDAAEAAARYALDAFPNTVHVFTGCTSRFGVTEQNASIATENAVKDGLDRVQSSRILWVPMMTDNPQFIRGSGADNNKQNDGNADLMFNTGDPIHWITQGHLIAGRDYFAPKIIAALRSWLQNQ